MSEFDSIPTRARLTSVRYNAKELRQNPKLEDQCIRASQEIEAIEVPKRKGLWVIVEIEQGMDTLGRYLALGLYPAGD